MEDLGFRPVATAMSAASAIGFKPLVAPAPPGFSLDVQGYVDPRVPNGDGATEGAFVFAFSSGADGVIVSQVERVGAGDSFVPDEADEASYRRVQVGANRRPSSTMVLVLGSCSFAATCLVTIEGDLSETGMTQLAEGMRSL